MRTAIIDDEPIFINLFRKLVSKLSDGRIISIDEFLSPNDFLNCDAVYDYIFLDIDMPEMNGIDLALARSDKHEKIIFVTNRELLVFKAVNLTSPMGFIRKSHLESDLRTIIDGIVRYESKQKYITVKKGTSVLIIPCSEIIYVEKHINNLCIHTTNEKIVYRSTLKKFEAELSGFGFVQSHEGFIVNVSYIYSIEATEIIMTDHSRTPLSRSNVKNVKEAFLRGSEIS